MGDDLREGKPTPLLAIASERARGDDVTLLSLVGSPHLDRDDVSAIQDVFVRTGAVSEIESAIDRLTGDAITAIRGRTLAGGAAEVLVELAEYVAWRDR